MAIRELEASDLSKGRTPIIITMTGEIVEDWARHNIRNPKHPLVLTHSRYRKDLGEHTMHILAGHVIAILLLLFSSTARAGLRSGIYEGLALGVNEATGEITGYYEGYSGVPDRSGTPPFRCIFFISGKIEDAPPHKIKTWFPADKDRSHVIEGTIKAVKEGSSPVLKVHLNKEHGGCWNVEHFADKDAASLEMLEDGDWREVRVVSSAKAFFHDSPDNSRKRKSYVVTGNSLRVYETMQNWVRASYVNEDEKKTEGWIKESDLFPAKAPQ